MVLALHFGLLGIYTNPFIHKKQKADYYAQWYAYPFFHQNWNLFVPPPDCNYKLFAIDQKSGLGRIDLFNEILLKHQSNRFKGYGPVLIAFINSIHYFEKSTTHKKDLNGPVQTDINFKILRHTALAYLKYSRHIDPKELRLILVVENTSNKRSRIYFD